MSLIVITLYVCICVCVHVCVCVTKLMKESRIRTFPFQSTFPILLSVCIALVGFGRYTDAGKFDIIIVLFIYMDNIIIYYIHNKEL